MPKIETEFENMETVLRGLSENKSIPFSDFDFHFPDYFTCYCDNMSYNDIFALQIIVRTFYFSIKNISINWDYNALVFDLEWVKK